MNKDVVHTVLEYQGENVAPNQKFRFDSSDSLVVPVMPPTIIGLSKLLQIFYSLKVCLMLLLADDKLPSFFSSKP